MSGKLRATLVGLAAGGLVFLGLGLYLNRVTGFGTFEHPGPVGVLALIGATVGGLVGPLLAGLAGGRESGSDEAGGRGAGEDGVPGG